jgi:hypothetical protein
VKLRCPSCSQEYNYDLDFREGNHQEHQCGCGTKLQADFPIKAQGSAGGGFSIEIGPPQPCGHLDKRDSAALVPICVF